MRTNPERSMQPENAVEISETHGTFRAVSEHELRQVDGGWVAAVAAVAWGAAYAYGVYRQFD